MCGWFLLLHNTTHHYKALGQITEPESEVVAEKLRQKERLQINKQTNRQKNTHNYRKGENYIPPIYFVPGLC